MARRRARGRERLGPVRGIKPSAERYYRREMNRLLKKMRDDTLAILIPVLRDTQSEYLKDAFEDDIEIALNSLAAQFQGIRAEAEAVARNWAGLVAENQRDEFHALAREMMGISLEGVVEGEAIAPELRAEGIDSSRLQPTLKAKTRENVNLITSIPQQYHNEIETLVWESVVQGATPARGIAAEIKHRWNVSKSRAHFIARDQTSKLHGELVELRQRTLGVEEYIWMTVDDERVRPSHDVKHGKRFRWDDPPEDTGHPGHDYQCRCRARPVIPRSDQIAFAA